MPDCSESSGLSGQEKLKAQTKKTKREKNSMHKLLNQWCLDLDVQLKTPLKSSFPLGLFNQTLFPVCFVYLYFVLYLTVQSVEKGSKETLED